MLFGHRKFITIIALLYALELSPVAQAHNKVVVISRTGDELAPFALISEDKPSSADLMTHRCRLVTLAPTSNLTNHRLSAAIYLKVLKII